MTIQNQNIPKVRIEKSLNPVAMSLILAAAMLLILVAVMLILAVAMSILAVVKNTLFFIKGPGWILGSFCFGSEFFTKITGEHRIIVS